LAILAFRKSDWRSCGLSLLLVKILEISDVNTTINTSRHESFVFEEGHSGNGCWVLLEEMLFNSQNQIDNNNCTIDETNSKSLVIIIEALELRACHLIWHCEASSWLLLRDLGLESCTHFCYTFLEGLSVLGLLLSLDLLCCWSSSFSLWSFASVQLYSSD
jgi:hypothetical protein